MAAINNTLINTLDKPLSLGNNNGQGMINLMGNIPNPNGVPNTQPSALTAKASTSLIPQSTALKGMINPATIRTTTQKTPTGTAGVSGGAGGAGSVVAGTGVATGGTPVNAGGNGGSVNYGLAAPGGGVTGTPIDLSNTQGNQQQDYLNNLQNIKDNSTFDPTTGNYIPSGTNNAAVNGTVAGLLPGLLNTNNNPTVANIIQEEQKQVGGILTGQPGTPLELAQGRAGLIQNTANAAIANALQEQSLQQGAYSTALGAVKPITGVPYGTQTIQPGLLGTNGGTSGGTAVSTSDPFYQNMQTYAQALVDNQGSAIPSSVTQNQALMAQLLQMAKQIDPNFNYNTSQGVGSAQQSNAATAGTAMTTGNQGVYNSAIAKLADVQTMAKNIRSFGDQAITNIKSLPLTQSQLANTSIQTAMTQFNSPQFAQFNANIQGLQARVSALLGTGEIPSSATAGAQAIINGTLNLGSLQSTLDQINNEADAIVQNTSTQASNAYANIKSNAGATSSGGKVSVGGYNFVQDANGNWKQVK